jgi:Tol biopolymer transport system component
VLVLVAALTAAGLTTWLLTRAGDPSGGSGEDPPPGTGGPVTDALPAADGGLPAGALVLSRETDGPADLYAVDAGSGEVVARLTDTPEADVAPVVLPGRRTVVYSRSGDAGGELRVVAADGTGDRPLFPDGIAGCDTPGRPTFDPTDPGRLALVCRDEAGAASLRLVTLDGAEVSVLHEGDATLGDPAFSPDGTRIVFFAGDDAAVDGGALYVVELDTPGTITPVTDSDGGEDADPSWSPDGRQLAWRRDIVPGQRGIVIGSPDVVGDARFVTSGAFDQDPVWSPDGATIAFKSSRAGDDAPDGDQIWLIDADGSDVRQMPASEGAVVNAPAWADFG